MISANLSPNEMVTKRRMLLIFSMVTFALWQSARIISEIGNPAGHSGSWWFALNEVEDFSLGLWVAGCLYLGFFILRLHQRPNIAAIINDELYNQYRQRAASFAFGCTIGAQVLIVLVASFHPLTAIAGADITILVGCTSFIGSVVYFDRD